MYLLKTSPTLCLFTLLMVSLDVLKFLSLKKYNLPIFYGYCFCAYYTGNPWQPKVHEDSLLFSL